MTYASVVDSVKAGLTTAVVPPFVTVDEVEQLPAFLDAGGCPAVLLLEVPGRRVPLGAAAGVAPGLTEEDWWLECHIFAFYGDTTNADGFRGLVDSVQAAFADMHYLSDGRADTPSSQVISAGLVLDSRIQPWQEDQGLVQRAGMVRAQVCELYH
jgi:hypothetical protein